MSDAPLTAESEALLHDYMAEVADHRRLDDSKFRHDIDLDLAFLGNVESQFRSRLAAIEAAARAEVTPLTEWRRMYLQLLDSWSAVCDAAGLDGDAAPDEIVARLQRLARAEAADEVARLTADLVAATDPASCAECGHERYLHGSSLDDREFCDTWNCTCPRWTAAPCDHRRAHEEATVCGECGATFRYKRGWSQPAPDATPCAECGHPCDATFCGCVAACKAHQS